MKFSVTKAALLKEMQLADAVIDRKTTIQIIAYALVETTERGISIASTSLSDWLLSSVEAEVMKAGRAVVPITQILKLVNDFSDGPIQFDVSAKGLTVTSGRSSTRFPLLPVEDFPTPPTPETSVVDIQAGLLAGALRRVRHAVKSDGRYWLDCANVVIDESGLIAVATDGHRISEASCATIAVREPMSALVPSRALDCLIKTLSAVAADAQVSIGFSGNFATFSVGTRQLFCRLSEGRFPQYKRTIPANPSRIARIDSDAFQMALRRLLVVATKEKSVVKLNITNGELVCSSETPVGVYKEPIAVDYDGTDIELGFNPKYLLDALDSLDAPAVRICVDKEVNAVVFRPADTEDRYCAVMTMRS